MKPEFDANSPLALSLADACVWLETLREQGCYIVREGGVEDLIWRVGPESPYLMEIHRALVCELRESVRNQVIATMSA